MGWLSGFDEETGKVHPTAGGLRIGKKWPERLLQEPYDDEEEWDRDGKYYHYLTKWMQALMRLSERTGDLRYLTWGIEMACKVQGVFTYSRGRSRRMYWKMSVDLSRPQVPSMGQHDPLDGYLTYNQLRVAARDDTVLREQIGDLYSTRPRHNGPSGHWGPALRFAEGFSNLRQHERRPGHEGNDEGDNGCSERPHRVQPEETRCACGATAGIQRVRTLRWPASCIAAKESPIK